MILKKTCCPELDHPIKEGTEVAVPCFPLGTSMDTIRNLNDVNVNYSVWDSEYEGCVLYGTWKAENESSIRAAERENKDREASERAADEQRKRERDAAAAANEADKKNREAQKSEGQQGGGSIQIGGEGEEGEDGKLGTVGHIKETLKQLLEAKLALLSSGGHIIGAATRNDVAPKAINDFIKKIKDVMKSSEENEYRHT